MNAILCSLELRESMKNLSNNWKMTKGWFNELHLNVGINEGQEYFERFRIADNRIYGTWRFGQLCGSIIRFFACYGSIWTTKNLMNR